jgi:hypothetical protein
MSTNKALIAVVAGLGAVIAALLIALGYGFVRTAADPEFRMFSDSNSSRSARAGGGDIPGPPEVPILLGPGTDLVSWEAEDGRLILHIVPAVGGDELIVIDVTTGRVIRRVVVRKQQ